jgi:hypothetical protein
MAPSRIALEIAEHHTRARIVPRTEPLPEALASQYRKEMFLSLTRRGKRKGRPG